MKMNLPNRLTLLRVILIPFFIVFYMTELIPQPYGRYVALVIFILASYTDHLDGKIARSRNIVTNFGKFMDPLADKLLVMSALLILLEQGALRAWACIVILAREFIVSSLRSIAASKGVVLAASYWGKLKTTSQLICIMYLLSGIRDYDIAGSLTLKSLLIWIMLFFTVFSGYDYLKRNFGLIKDGVVKGE